MIEVARTLFKKGDNLRITIEFWDDQASGRDYALMHCPDNTAFVPGGTVAGADAGKTRLTVAVPYELGFI